MRGQRAWPAPLGPSLRALPRRPLPWQRALASAAQARGSRLTMLYDGDCPLCMREVRMLQRRDADKGAIAFVDIAAPDYQPVQGISYDQAMKNIHVVRPDGGVVTNVEAFKVLYEEVGLGWVYGFTRYEPLRQAAEWVYGVWAKYRLPITGRDAATALAKKEACKAPQR